MFPSWRLQSPSQSTRKPKLVLGLVMSLCFRAVMDSHQMKAAYKKMGCNSSAPLTGQHKKWREAGSWAITPPLLARYVFYSRNWLKFSGIWWIEFWWSHKGNLWWTSTASFPAQLMLQALGSEIFLSNIFTSILFSNPSISPDHGQHLPRQRS